MTAENLLDAIGLVEDRFLVESPRRPVVRRFLVLAAVIAALMLSAVTAMAVNEDFREIVFSVFRISTIETPPMETTPTETGLQQMKVVTIDDTVTAAYFAKDCIVRTQDGGFYTCDYDTHDHAAFWEIGADKILEVPAAREDFVLEYAGRVFRIRFDYAILNGKLAIEVWPEGLDEDPVGNGWNLEPIGDRQDAALLSIPVLEEAYYNTHYLLLDLNTLETEILLASETPLDHADFTADLRYAIGISGAEYLFCDLEAGTSTPFDAGTEPYFLNEETLICKVPRGDGCFDLVQHHIPTGVSRTLLESISADQYRSIHSGGGYHGLLNREELIDLRTAEHFSLTGLDKGFLRTDESPMGSRILLAWEPTSEAGFTSLGLLDPGTGVLKLLRRNVSGHAEYLWGWLDETTVVILATDHADAYWVYTYRFA